MEQQDRRPAEYLLHSPAAQANTLKKSRFQRACAGEGPKTADFQA